MFESIENAGGTIFSAPDVDKAREFFKNKKRSLYNKEM